MSHDVDVLNRLIAGLRGAAAGYRRAGADGPGLADVFAAPARTYDGIAEQLAAEIRALGGVASEGDRSTHAWADLPRAVAGGEAGIAAAVERVAAELLAGFQAATDDPAISDHVRAAIRRASDSARAGHDRVLQRLDAPSL